MPQRYLFSLATDYPHKNLPNLLSGLSFRALGFAAASAVGGAATSFGMLVAARATQGAFGALLAPAALSILSTQF